MSEITCIADIASADKIGISISGSLTAAGAIVVVVVGGRSDGLFYFLDCADDS